MSAAPEVDLSTRVYQAVQLVSEPDPALEAHTEWLIGVLLDRLKPEDLTPQEKMAVAIILAGANSRKLALTESGEAVTNIAGVLGGLGAPPVGGRPPLRAVPNF
jgi:hypothetical protein